LPWQAASSFALTVLVQVDTAPAGKADAAQHAASALQSGLVKLVAFEEQAIVNVVSASAA
jgi:hypothetical protein